MKKTLIAAACIIGVAASAAAASGKSRGGGDRFDKMDTNGDGIVTAAELDARQAALIDAADANGDGGLTAEELSAHRKAKREEWRAKNNPDTNGDGVVDRVEFLASAEKRFDRLDKNSDGVISEDERRSKRGRRHHRGHRGE